MEGELYANLPNGCYEMKYEHLHDVCELLIDAFITNNKIWSSAKLNRGQLKEFFTNVILEHFESQNRVRQTILPNAVINFIYVLNGKLVSCLMHYEIEEYRQKQRNYKEPSIPLFVEL